MSPGGQDPNVYAQDGTGQFAAGTTPLKVDIWSEDLLGIVGGPAKDERLEHFTRICNDLVRICASHNKRPVVFTAFGSRTPLRRRGASSATAIPVCRTPRAAHGARSPDPETIRGHDAVGVPHLASHPAKEPLSATTRSGPARGLPGPAVRSWSVP
ncbi:MULTISPECIES: hypothetical protein [unclassified Streptomyces]|uniref:hypothetical protein n=1 Tax=unclassified Streptomyces TaxID=2593676 RepID=UPI00344C44FC